ncbi:MAG TPA: NUDIX domain-containing protein [Candidatus Binataceae bacterium]|nr:NUDIX domain-containing protein [Candidatus Binataceae bacterium]
MASRETPTYKKRAQRKGDGPETRREFSAGGVIWRREDGRVQVVMVRPAGKNVWTLPKGRLDAGESMVDAAARETREETGLQVTAGEKLGDISYVFSWHDSPDAPVVRIFKRVRYFLMTPTGGDLSRHDSETEVSAWFDLNDALSRAAYRGDREILEKVRDAVAKL